MISEFQKEEIKKLADKTTEYLSEDIIACCKLLEMPSEVFKVFYPTIMTFISYLISEGKIIIKKDDN